MTAVLQPRPSPYVGSRAFEPGETLCSRDREVMELLDLLIAERILLLYSSSRAGQTSYIRAALNPEPEKEGFRVLPTTCTRLEPALVGQVSRPQASPLPGREATAGKAAPLSAPATLRLGGCLGRPPDFCEEQRRAYHREADWEPIWMSQREGIMSTTAMYADVKVHIHRRDEKGYPVEITLNRALQFRTGYLDREISGSRTCLATRRLALLPSLSVIARELAFGSRRQAGRNPEC